MSDSTGVRLRKAVLLFLALFAAISASALAAAAENPAGSDPTAIAFSTAAPVLELKAALSPYHAPSGQEADGSLWYIVTVANNGPRAMTRVLVASDPADAAFRFFPLPGRAAIRQVASSDGGIVVAREPAFGRHAFRVTVPPGTSAALALRLSHADAPPSVLAWREPALVAYRKQLAIFLAAVGGLIAAAAAITGGVAAMTRHAAPRWAALTLTGVFVLWLSTAGLFDHGWTTSVGGPYGFMAMIGGLSLAAAWQLVESVAPLSDLWPWAERYRRWGILALAGVSFLAFVGVPGAAFFVDVLLVFGAAALAAYLVRRGMSGSRPARVLAPSATVFALVTLASALAVLGGFHNNPIASELIGGFAAAGAVLVALAIAAGEGLGLMGLSPVLAPQPASAVPSPVQTPAEPSPHPLRAALAESEAASVIAAVGASHQGIYDLDFRTDTLHLSAEAAALIGYSKGAQSIPHSAWIGRVHAEDRTIYKEALYDYRNHPGLAFRIEFRVRSESGRYPWFELRATMMGEGEQSDRCLGLMADVTTRKEAEAAAIDRTMRDPLTGLGNRVALMEELEGVDRHMTDMVFCILDIDRFKAIHASLGDAGADAVLKRMAERLTNHFEDTVEIFRVGGDAFALLLHDTDGEPNALGAGLVELCAAPFVENGRKIFAPASVGLATARDIDEPLDLLRNAELALRQAKRQGGACARVYSSDMDGAAPRDAVALEADLRRALDEGQIDVFYQPIVRLSDRSVAGFEALLRWHHPERGLVWPTDFIGHSEETGLIVELGRFALMRAAEDLARWQRFFPVDPPLFVSVNVSRRQLQDGTFEADLEEVLRDTPLVPGSLRLEITESAIATNANAEERLNHIRRLGAGLAIDDFGTGLSSLSQLRAIPFDVVKVDKSFLARRGGEADAEVILASIIGLARELKRAIVVEGVESEEDAVRLAGMGCEYAQGFHFSVPLPAREALNFIAMHYDATAATSAPEARE